MAYSGGDIDLWWESQKEEAVKDGMLSARQMKDASHNPYWPHDNCLMDEELGYLWHEGFRTEFNKMRSKNNFDQ